MNKEASSLLAKLVTEIYKNEQLQQKVKQLETIINNVSNCLEENRKQYIYQDGLDEDWYFEDLDVFNELSSILERGKE